MAFITADYFNTNGTTLGLKSSFSPKAEQLDVLIADASEWVEGYCRRVIEQRDVVQTLVGGGRNRLLLREWPIKEVKTIAWVNDIGGTGTVDPTLVRVLAGGILEFINVLDGPWYLGRTYTITYTAGYSPIPGRVQRATALKVVDLMGPQYTGARDTRSVEVVTNLEATIADLLEDYRRDNA